MLISLDKNAKFVSIKNKLYIIKLDYFNVWYFEGRFKQRNELLKVLYDHKFKGAVIFNSFKPGVIFMGHRQTV